MPLTEARARMGAYAEALALDQVLALAETWGFLAGKGEAQSSSAPKAPQGVDAAWERNGQQRAWDAA